MEKSIFKKYWFWLIVIFVFAFLINEYNEDDQKKVSEITEGKEEEKSKEKEKKEYFSVGEVAKFEGVKITLLNVKENIGTIFNKPDSGKVFVFPEFLIENNSEKPITINSWSSFNSYADSFLIDIDMKASISEDSKRLSGKVAPGKKLQGSLSYQLDKDYKELEINFNLSSGSKEIKFIYKK